MNGLLSPEAVAARRAMVDEVAEVRTQLRALRRRVDQIDTKRRLELELDELRMVRASLVDAADALELVDGVLEA